MTHTLASLIVAGVVLSAGSFPGTSAQSVRHQPAELDILVNGAPQRRYVHEGRWYVEALKGREYAIRMRNPYPVRVAVALSVDGLNTIDARHTGAAAARKWVLGPYETVTISGWQTSRTDAHRFEFTTEDKSYGQALGQTANLGVISAVFFKERVAVIARKPATQGQDQRAAAPAPPASAASPSLGRFDGSVAESTSTANKIDQDYAATGMGQRTDHAVTEVQIDLESVPAQTINIRYEYRSQLVRLGILPAAPIADPLQRRERARGFESGFSPELPRR